MGNPYAEAKIIKLINFFLIKERSVGDDIKSCLWVPKLIYAMYDIYVPLSSWAIMSSKASQQTVLIPAKWPPTRLRVTLQKR